MTRFGFRNFGHAPDYILLGVVLLLLVGGMLFLSSASSDIGKIKHDDSLYFVKNQIYKGLVPGAVGFLLGYLVYYRKWRKFAWVALGANIILLVLVFTPLGLAANGASRWISFGGFSFQPSELLKITFILYVASLFSSARLRQKKGWTSYWLFAGVSAVVGLLILFQPATTMIAIVIGAGAVAYFYSGAPFRQFLVTGVLAVVLVAFLALVTPYRLNRIAPFWNSFTSQYAPSLSIDGGSYDQFHLNQSLIAIGTGGVWGVGFGKSTSKFSVLPEPMGDSIFSVIAEEVGFVGSVVTLCLYILLFWRGTVIARRSHDDFGRLVVVGFSSVFAIQAIIHIAANSGLAPFTGVPLPLVSYGGTSLAVSLTMLGILANISRHTTKK